jgi:hypothetical protein
VLQTAIGPVILISGVGLLLFSMTNRSGRVIDRARLLDAKFANLPMTKQGRRVAQLFILCTFSLIGSLLLSIHDLNQSLTTLKLELEDTMPECANPSVES